MTDEHFESDERVSAPRRRLLEVAAKHIDKTYRPEHFGFSRGVHWCGVFALQCLHEAGFGRDITWKIGKGFLFRLHMTKSPKPGDMVYFAAKQHHAILERLDGDTVHTIDGNQAGGKVLRRTRPLAEVAAFYSIENLIHTQR